MNTLSDCPPKIAQSRHILALAGISLWAKKHETTGQNRAGIITLPPAYDRLQPNPRLTHLLPDELPAKQHAKPITAPNTTPTPDKSQISSAVDVRALLDPASLSADNPPSAELTPATPESQRVLGSIVTGEQAQSPVQPNPITNLAQAQPFAPPAHLDIRFALQGVRFGQWVLIVDMLLMSRDEQSLWQSLKNALSNQANHRPITAFYREIGYPLVKNEFRSDIGLNPAQYTFDGFVIGLCVSSGHHQAVQVAFLTDTPAGVIAQTTQTLPSIRQMMTSPALKKQFWQTVVG
ncbi:hypothetical protein LP123_08485 [Moraxella bovis]|uniref:Uncharacterized protein n=1 Tax=Moraxella bovis TaxID=476 RepID=A0AAQ2PZU9_MORBO|nr:hypothetical protein [Moraxella bovis]OOR90779.1 hypothetical protein B0182_04475 [Moraxella bovis]UYZ76793.1 hypothetical protein LP093_05790 [Moraxella bovis]UYZ77252.1 hypothetical protein LP115_08025 [Moraxella bovis]UYZ82265.1 hypothetical protein LP113_06105 [Moraxella bovis]UYZ85739.1 hypothetical protein LP094_08070 [Moraxella bovis]